MTQGSSPPGLCDNLEQWDGMEGGGEGGRWFPKREGTCVRLWVSHVDALQKPSQIL